MKFKPNMLNLIEERRMDPVILIPKNSGLKDIVSNTLKETGVNYLNFKKIDRDSYKCGDLSVLVYRAEDIPNILEDLYFDKKVKAMGFIGDDLFDEYKLRNSGTILQIFETIEWIDRKAKFLRPALCLMKRNGEKLKGKANVAVNEKYELTSCQAIEEVRRIIGRADYYGNPNPAELKDIIEFDPNIRVYKGNTELTVAQGLNDMCVEIVYSGSTLKRNGLEIIGKPLRLSDFNVIGVNEASPYVFQKEYETIMDRIKNPRNGSYTSEIASDPNKAFKKMGEEISELSRALGRYENTGDKEKAREEITKEASDLIYALFINAARCGVEFQDITKEMYMRQKKD